MRAPSTMSRIICAFIGAVAAPVAVGLISAGGGAWAVAQQYQYRGGALPFGQLLGPTLLMLLGLMLLVGVVLTGLFTASGLLAAGVVGIVPLLGTLAPGVALTLMTSRLVPVAFLGPLQYGLPAAILPLLGFMGITLVTVRRRPPTQSAAAALLGALVALVALAVGGGLLMWGVQLGVGRAFRVFDAGLHPLPALLVLLGFVLIGIGVGASRWSPFALVLPAALLLVLSLANALSPALSAVPTLRDLTLPTSGFLIFGGGVAVALAQLAFTVVLLVLRARIRRIGPASAGGPGAAANAVPPASYPPAGEAYPAQTPHPAPPTPQA